MAVVVLVALDGRLDVSERPGSGPESFFCLAVGIAGLGALFGEGLSRRRVLLIARLPLLIRLLAGVGVAVLGWLFGLRALLFPGGSLLGPIGFFAIGVCFGFYGVGFFAGFKDGSFSDLLLPL